METEITKNNFDQLLSSGKPLMVDFFATWCGPCKHIAPFVEQIANEYDGKAVVGRCDIDENSELAEKFGIMSVPTIIYFKDGKEQNRIVGGVPKKMLEDALKEIL